MIADIKVGWFEGMENVGGGEGKPSHDNKQEPHSIFVVRSCPYSSIRQISNVFHTPKLYILTPNTIYFCFGWSISIDLIATAPLSLHWSCRTCFPIVMTTYCLSPEGEYTTIKAPIGQHFFNPTSHCSSFQHSLKGREVEDPFYQSLSLTTWVRAFANISTWEFSYPLKRLTILPLPNTMPLSTLHPHCQITQMLPPIFNMTHEALCLFARSRRYQIQKHVLPH